MAKKQWPICQVCGKPVSTEQGVLVIFMKDIDQHEKQYLQWQKSHPTDVVSCKEMCDCPMLVRWHWGHASCLPDKAGYDIAYSRFDTISKALSWTLHLMEKNWFPSTAWEQAVKAHHHIADA